MKSVLVVGAGIAGAVVAWECAEAGYLVTVIEKSEHIGGNCRDYDNEHGEKIHAEGPHLFHADSKSPAVAWLSQFTEWVPYEHRVRALLEDGRTTPLPVNATTLEDVFGVKLETEEEAQELLDDLRDKSIGTPINTDEVFLKSTGEYLANIFFRPYTAKMWSKPATEIEAKVGARIPTRTNRDDRYFTDSFQQMPEEGFSAIFEKIFQHPNIHLIRNKTYNCHANEFFNKVFLSCPIDEYYDYQYGSLPYRSVKFEEREVDSDQPATTVNFTDDGIYTRSTQWSLIPTSGRREDGKSTVTYEIPCDPRENDGKCYYPVRNEDSLNLYRRYEELAERDGLTFIGRLGLFLYYDIAPCVNATLMIVRKWIKSDSLVESENTISL